MNGVQLEEINSFTYLEVTFSKEGSSTTDTHIMATATAAMERLDRIGHSHSILRGWWELFH